MADRPRLRKLLSSQYSGGDVNEHVNGRSAEGGLVYPYAPPAPDGSAVEVAPGILWLRMPMPMRMVVLMRMGMVVMVMIVAMLINSPDLLIADEPTSALDVMVRGQVLQMMDREIQRRGMGLILISHDLNTVARYCDRVLIMYKGRIVETCRADRLFEAQHPYTRGLLACLPSAATRGQRLSVLDRAAIEAAAC